MARILTQQYRPVTDIETAEADGLSSRVIRDHARNVNIFKATQNPRFVLNVGDYTAAKFGTIAATARYFFQAHVPARTGYSEYRVRVWARLDGVVAPSVFTVYSDLRPYRGTAAAAFDLTELTPAYKSVAINITSNTDAWYTDDLLIARRQDDYTSHLITTLTCPSHQVYFGAFDVQYEELS